MVDLRLGRVYIFGYILIAFKCTPAKSYHPAGKAMYREHHPATITIIQRPVIPFNGEAAFF